MSKVIYIYTKNHSSNVGIQSLIKLIREIFENYQIILTKKIHNNATNIIIENFSNSEVKNILKNKKKNVKLILILTEFLNSKANIFNCFELKKNYFKYIPFQYFTGRNIYLFFTSLFFLFFYFFQNIEILYFLISYHIYLFLKKIAPRKWYYKNKTILYKHIKFHFNFDVKKTPIYKYLRFFEYIFLFYFLNRAFENLRNSNIYVKMVMYQYFRERYLNCRKIIRYADVIFVTHPNIFSQFKKYNKNIYYLLPKIKKFKPNLEASGKFIFKFSGEYSKFRNIYFNTLINKVNKKKSTNIKLKKYINLFKKKISKRSIGNFIDLPNSEKYRYSFHPRKNIIWYFSSPIRYLEAINKGEIPIISDNFKDFFTINLTINVNSLLKKNIDFEKNYFKNLVLLKKKIKIYNKFTDKNLEKIKNFL
jgi:hypothetical protein